MRDILVWRLLRGNSTLRSSVGWLGRQGADVTVFQRCSTHPPPLIPGRWPKKPDDRQTKTNGPNWPSLFILSSGRYCDVSQKRCECFIFGRSRIVDMLNVNKKQQFVAQVISPKVACSAGELSLKWRKNSRNTRVNVCDANCKCVDQGTEEIRSLWRHGLRHNDAVRSVLFILRLQQGCSRKCLAYAWM